MTDMSMNGRRVFVLTLEDLTHVKEAMETHK
jgi:hypothetical protein